MMFCIQTDYKIHISFPKRTRNSFKKNYFNFNHNATTLLIFPHKFYPRIHTLKILEGLLGNLNDWTQCKEMRSTRDYGKLDSTCFT